MDDQEELTKTYLSQNDNRDILIAKDIPTDVSVETLENCLEVICDEGVDKIYFHEGPDGNRVKEVAVVYLEGKITDINKVNEKAKKKPLSGKTIKLCRLKDPTGIIVYGLSREATEDEIVLYFERKAIAGANADVVENKIHENIQAAVLNYENIGPALQNIFKTKHQIRKSDVTVEPYYEEFHETVIVVLKESVPQYIDAVIETNEYENEKTSIVATEEKKESDARISKTGSRVRIMSENMEELIDDDGYEMPMSMVQESNNKKIFQWEVSPPVNKQDFSITTKSDHIYTDIIEESDVPLIPRTPRPSQVRKPDVDEYSEKVSMDKGKIILLRIKSFSKECKECKIDLNTDEDFISFVGKKDSVTTAKLQMYQILDDIIGVTKSLSQCQAALLKSKSGWIRDTLKKDKVGAYCKVDDNTICCQAFSNQVAEKGLQIILSNLERLEIPYNEAHFKYINSEEWKNFVSDQNKVEIEMVREKKLIVVHGIRKGDCSSVKDLIRKELNKHAEAKTEKIEIKGSKSVCFHHGHHTDIDKLKNDISKKNGHLTYKYDQSKQTTWIELKGNPGLVEDMKTAINQWISSIWQGPVDLQKISNKEKDVAVMSKVLGSERGRKFLSTFEDKNKCGINVQKTKGTHQLHHVNSAPTVDRTEKPELRRSHTSADLGARPKEYTGRSYQGGRNIWIYKCHEGSVELILKHGNIAKEKADMLVNVVAQGIQFTTGVIPKNFIKEGGPEVEMNFMQASQEGDSNCMIVQTSGNLQCKSICHLVLPKWEGDKKVLITAIRNCLRSCSTNGYESVAFPAVGTGRLLKYPIDEVVDCLISEAKVAAKRSQSLKKIKFVIYGEEDVSLFQRILQGSSTSGGRDGYHRRNRSYDREENQSTDRETDKHKETVTVVSLELCAVSKAEGEKVRGILSKEIKDTFLYQDQYTDSRLKSLPKDVWKKMITAASKCHVWLKIDNDTLTMTGEREKVKDTRSNILEILLKENVGNNPKHHQYKQGSSEWWITKSDDSTSVPVYWKHFQGGPRGLFDKGKAYFGFGVEAKLVDVDNECKKNIMSLVMKTWESAKVGKGADAKNLKHSSIQIKNVQRIENYGLFQKYALKKKEFYHKLAHGKKYPALENVSSKRKISVSGPIQTAIHCSKHCKSLMKDLDLAGHANEYYFFHGTQDAFVKNIIDKGLDDKLGGENAMFGPGIYGAESSTKADQYADDQSNRHPKDRKMLLIRMLLGNMFVTDRGHKFKIPPCSNCLKTDCIESKHEKFDSVVADGTWLFREFVVYRCEQCYPEYLITYDRI